MLSDFGSLIGGFGTCCVLSLCLPRHRQSSLQPNALPPPQSPIHKHQAPHPHSLRADTCSWHSTTTPGLLATQLTTET